MLYRHTTNCRRPSGQCSLSQLAPPPLKTPATITLTGLTNDSPPGARAAPATAAIDPCTDRDNDITGSPSSGNFVIGHSAMTSTATTNGFWPFAGGYIHAVKFLAAGENARRREGSRYNVPPAFGCSTTVVKEKAADSTPAYDRLETIVSFEKSLQRDAKSVNYGKFLRLVFAEFFHLHSDLSILLYQKDSTGNAISKAHNIPLDSATLEIYFPELRISPTNKVTTKIRISTTQSIGHLRRDDKFWAYLRKKQVFLRSQRVRVIRVKAVGFLVMSNPDVTHTDEATDELMDRIFDADEDEYEIQLHARPCGFRSKKGGEVKTRALVIKAVTDNYNDLRDRSLSNLAPSQDCPLTGNMTFVPWRPIGPVTEEDIVSEFVNQNRYLTHARRIYVGGISNLMEPMTMTVEGDSERTIDTTPLQWIVRNTVAGEDNRLILIAIDRAGPNRYVFSFHEQYEDEARQFIDEKLVSVLKLLSAHMQKLIFSVGGDEVGRESNEPKMDQTYAEWAQALTARRQNPQGGDSEGDAQRAAYAAAPARKFKRSVVSLFGEEEGAETTNAYGKKSRVDAPDHLAGKTWSAAAGRGVPDSGATLAEAAAKKAQAERGKKRADELSQLSARLEQSNKSGDERMDTLERDRDDMHKVLTTMAESQLRADKRVDRLQEMMFEVMGALQLSTDKFRAAADADKVETVDAASAPPSARTPSQPPSSSRRADRPGPVTVSPSSQKDSPAKTPTCQHLRKKRRLLVKDIEATSDLKRTTKWALNSCAAS